ncbi:MAG: AAA family ATPase [Armatimonadetes bacterium]|nr:AAA family ATPase [Armatimonadota bacterium]
MPTERGPIYFLAGAPGVGKSTAARLLAERFDRAVLFDIDTFRKLVVKGLSEPSENWNEETTLQFHLAHAAVGKSAKTYADAGFAVVAEQCSSLEDVKTFLEHAGPAQVICLRAEMETNLTRNRERQNKSFDPLMIEHFVRSLGDSMPAQFREAGYPVIDTTNLAPEQVVAQILSLREAF